MISPYKIGQGRDRTVIIDVDKQVVIKIAKNENGFIQNYNEFMLNKKRPDITAKVLEYHGEFLLMEYVTELPNLNEKDINSIDLDEDVKRLWNIVYLELEKEIGDALFDNEQIGITKDGRVVAYDYGHTRNFIFETKYDGHMQRKKFKDYKCQRR